MKKFIAILFLIVFAFACGPNANAQDKTVTRYLKTGVYYDLYNGTSARGDTLSENQDSISYVFVYQSKERISKVAVKVKFDLRSGADTTVNYQLDGKAFNDVASYTSIVSATTGSAISANNTVYNFEADYTETVTAYTMLTDTTGLAGYPADSISVPAQTVTPIDYSYRYFQVLLVIQGNDATGTGVIMDEMEIKFYVE